MTRYLQIWGVQLRTSLATAMTYRASFILDGFMSLVWIALALLPLIVLFDQRSMVSGWDRPSALIVIAYFFGVKAVMEGIVSPSLIQLVERIRNGAFDYVLLKPVDAQFMISACNYEPEKIFDFIGAIVIATYAFILRGYPPTVGQVALGLALFVAGVFAMYSLWILCAAAAFWVVRLDNLIYLLQAIFDTARWPVQVFRGVWRILFTFIIPVAVMTTFPAMAMLGRLSARATLATFGGAIAMIVISRLVWRAAIRNYTSASS